MKEVVCIVCPRGCRLQVDEERDYLVTGQGCDRGEEYGRLELTNPTRVLTSTVRIDGARYARCPVKTDRAVPKGILRQVMALLDEVALRSPVESGAVVVENVFGTGANVVTTRAL